MKLRFTYFLAFMLICSPLSIDAQHMLHTEGAFIVNEMQDTVFLRAMGLGGWMVQEGYMLQTQSFANAQHQIRNKILEAIGEEDTELFYENWLNNHVRKSDIEAMKSWGFNAVRLPMHYNLFTLPIEDEPIPGEYTWLTRGFELTDSLISWCKQNEMYVILDLHAAPGGQGYDQAISDYDPSKPSLWESQANKDKTVALWKKLAEKYSNEAWVAGYDLLNEPNWDLPGGVALKNLYKEITDSIRTVDTNHILFIEGNWFANDFTGLTPPWDDNFVYAPHKYWSFNNEASIQWVLDLRDTYNVPLFFGESGENSNVWFRDAIRLFEDQNISWAWWPLKKVESISGPLSIVKSEDYQALLDYWNGSGGSLNDSIIKATLMELSENLKTEKCIFQKDVIDAMFRQVHSDITLPFKNHEIPGIIYASDYDLGRNGYAYFDVDDANYSVSTGNFTNWNTGWQYRNDGVDIEKGQDTVNSNGFIIGFLEKGEWMQYELGSIESGVYDINVRIASGGSGGHLHLAFGASDITNSTFVPPTGGWQKWKTLTISDVILGEDDHKLKFFVDNPGFNISSFEFIKTGDNTSVLPTIFIDARTTSEYSLQLNTNKFIDASSNIKMSDFEIQVNEEVITIDNIKLDSENSRILNFSLGYLLNSTDEIRISYTGDEILALDETPLEPFELKSVKNLIQYVHQIPGKIQAEDFMFQEGVELEMTSDDGGGYNIGFLDPGDYLDYEINVTQPGIFELGFRTAAQYGTGKIELQLLDEFGNKSVIGSGSFPSTGGWQVWNTYYENVQLEKGRYTLRMLITQGPLNMNWLDFKFIMSSDSEFYKQSTFELYPNPSFDHFTINADFLMPQDFEMELYHSNGQRIEKINFSKISRLRHDFHMTNQPAGLYFLTIRMKSQAPIVYKIIRLEH